MAAKAAEPIVEHTRTGMSPETLAAAFKDNLNYVLGRPLELASASSATQALALVGAGPSDAALGQTGRVAESARNPGCSVFVR